MGNSHSFHSPSVLLIRAARDGKLQDVRDLLQKGEANINVTDEDGNTALMVALQARHTEIAVELLKHKNLDVNL